MNGRMYDANLGRFLSPDNYIQDPFHTQSFNRYGYVLNNPLMYTDFTGEKFWKSVGDWFQKHSKVITAVVTIAVAVVLTVATAGIASPLLAGAIIGAGAGFTAGAVGTWTQGGSFLSGLGNGLLQGAIGAVSGAVGAGVGKWASKGLGDVVIQGFNVVSPVAKGAIAGALGGAAGGYAGSFVAGAIATGSLKDAHQAGLSGLALGAGIGALSGGAAGYKAAKANKLSEPIIELSSKSGRSSSGKRTFSHQARFPKSNLNLRLDRGFRAPLKGTNNSLYLGKPYDGFNTHINIQRPGSYNYHIPLNPLKWKYYTIP